MLGHLLIIMPHPDDESFACGGTIALHTQAGGAATYVCGTRGEMGRNMGKPPFATRESLPALREKELRDACAVLGIGDLRFLGIRDKTVEFVDPVALANQIREIIEEIRPSLIITYHPTHGVHPDHNALGAATIRAVAAMPPEERPPVHCRAFGARLLELGAPDLTVDVRSVLETKRAAIRAHRSQSEIMLARMEARMAKDETLRRQMERDQSRERFWIYPI